MEIQNTTQVNQNVQQMRQIASGVSWIKSIALLSLLNGVIFSFGSNISFVVGLGITQFFSAIIFSLNLGTNGIILSILFTLFISGIFGLLWYFANKMHLWAMIAAVVLYGLDTLLFILIKDYLSLGFHIYAGFFMVWGLKSMFELVRNEK